MRTFLHSLAASSLCHQRSWYLLGDFSARQSLRTADSRQRIAELLRGEDALAGLLHGSRNLLATGLARLLCISFIYHLVNWTRHVDTRFRSQPQSAPFPAIDAYRNCERTIGQREHFVDLSNLDPLNSQSIFGQ